MIQVVEQPPHPDDDVQILNACRTGDLQTLRHIAARMRDMDAFRRKCEILNHAVDGQRTIHIAAAFGWIKICKYLINEVNVDIDIKTDDESTALLLAIHNGEVHAAKYLINRGADITISDPMGLTPLHYAAIIENRELMQLLVLKRAPSINEKSVPGTPLEVATRYGKVDSVRFLLARGAELDSGLQPSAFLLILAISSRSSKCLELLLSAGADPSSIASSTTPLVHAAKHNALDFISSLLQAGANPNQVDGVGLAPIEYAASAPTDNMVEILFPVTRRIEAYPNWSINGLMEHMQSERGRRQIEQRRDAKINDFRSRGDEAMMRRQYGEALEWYSEAINSLGSPDATLLLHRSQCYSQLGRHRFALSDAMECLKLQQLTNVTTAKEKALAHYGEGRSWMGLNNYRRASTAFKRATSAEPRDQTYEEAFKTSVHKLIMELLAKYPLECARILDRFGFGGHMEL